MSLKTFCDKSINKRIIWRKYIKWFWRHKQWEQSVGVRMSNQTLWVDLRLDMKRAPMGSWLIVEEVASSSIINCLSLFLSTIVNSLCLSKPVDTFPQHISLCLVTSVKKVIINFYILKPRVLLNCYNFWFGTGNATLRPRSKYATTTPTMQENL